MRAPRLGGGYKWAVRAVRLYLLRPSALVSCSDGLSRDLLLSLADFPPDSCTTCCYCERATPGPSVWR